MGFEQKINQRLNQHPLLKKRVKRVYQRISYALSSKVRCEGAVVRLSPEEPGEYFFGYYDKSPWDATGRYVLCMKARDTRTEAAPRAPAEILLIDTQTRRARVIARTRAWNVQQGCMAQWLGPGFDTEIIYNDFRGGAFCSVVLRVFSGEERVLAMPVYSVAADGSFALTLDFARLHRLRPGYGYSNVEDATRGEKLPSGPCVWRLDIARNAAVPLLRYGDLAALEPRPEMAGAEHKVNHIMLSPSGKRFMVIHRWLRGQRKYSRLVTVNADGTEPYNLSDDDMVSHCCWKSDEEILAFARKRATGAGYYLLRDRSPAYRRLWPHIASDGHPSYSPDGRLVVTDTYPNRKRVATLKILNDDFQIIIARVFAPFAYDNDTRCDLHPRWSRDGRKVCFDAAFEGRRGLYAVDVGSISFAYSEATGTKLHVGKDARKIVYLMTSCRKLGPAQQTLNIIKGLDHERFQPILITLYDEEADSQMARFLPYVSSHALVKTGRRSILLGRDDALRRALDAIRPDLIHTVGVFPDYAVARMGKYRQLLTLRNFVYDDYPAKFGRVRGGVLARMQLYAARRAAKAVTCSESLARLYRERLGLALDFIRNGVDVALYASASNGEKLALRKSLGLPEASFIFVYTGQFIPRKNIPFLLEAFVAQFRPGEAYLLLLGGGPELEALRAKYGGMGHVDFRGSVAQVGEYLRACDCYVSASKSEGLPNGVLEAMATGLPAVLSDIAQHQEIFEAEDGIGYLYRQGDVSDLRACLRFMAEGDHRAMGALAYHSAHSYFNAELMSRRYQEVYRQTMAGDA